MFSPKFVLKGNLQARTRSPLPRGRAGRAPGAPGGDTHREGSCEVHTCACKDRAHAHGCHTCFRLSHMF